MKKKKTYRDVKFNPEVIREASEIMDSLLSEVDRTNLSYTRDIELTENEGWSYDTDEEFFSDFRNDHYCSTYSKRKSYFVELSLTYYKQFRFTIVTIEAPRRQQIESLFEVFEKNIERCQLPPIPETPKQKPHIFIGHGQSEQWRDLKDHLHEKHGYDIEAYEIGARAGHVIRDILEEMLNKTSFAILVLTGEDKEDGGNMRARQNVIHELGLFQGRLGFAKAVVLLEDGTEEFSNIHGVHQIRYKKGNVKETFGDVLATLRREFKGS